MKLLRSLYALVLPAACRELRSVEQEVRWRLRRLKYQHLAFLAESSATHMQERGSPELLAELLLQLERRWTEIDDGRTAVALMAKAGHLSEPLMNRLEDKVPRQGGHFLMTCGAPCSHVKFGPCSCCSRSRPRWLLKQAVQLMGPGSPTLGPGDKCGCRQGFLAQGHPGGEPGGPAQRGPGLVSSGPVAVPQGRCRMGPQPGPPS